MKMLIVSLEYTNIRKFKNLKINLADEDGKIYKNSFIMMGNGTGKTTTITLIKGLLDGTAEKWPADVVRSFAPVSNVSDSGCFKLVIRFNDNRYIYILNLNYKNGTAEIRCTAAIQGGFGPRTFPSALNGLFTEEFVRRFVFDGEQATKAMDNTSNEADEAIKYLYRLDVFDEISRTNRQILSTIQDAEGGAAGTDRSVQVLRTKQNNVKATINRLSNRQKEIRDDINKKKSTKEDLENKISRINERYKELNKEREEVIKRRDETKNKIDLCISNILTGSKSPYLLNETICLRMFELGDCMTKLKLPKTISKDFFNELANEKRCICGREIGPREQKAILENAERFLGSDQQSVLNTIKSSLMNSVYDDRVQKSFEELDHLTRELKIAEDNLMNVDDRLTKAGGEEAVRLREERDTVINELGHLEEELDIIESKDESNKSLTEENNLSKAYFTYNELENKIASATRTNDALHRKNIVESLIEKIKAEATKRLKQEIIQKANDKLRTVITDDQIEIESIEKYIQLKGKTGASEGQTLSIAYCFLGTMFEDSELQFPFIIDSPAGKMDYVKRRAVANILPTLFNQLVAFVTSAEVEQFADQFYTDSNSQFITIIANPIKDAIEVYHGKDYFDSYQRDYGEEEN